MEFTQYTVYNLPWESDNFKNFNKLCIKEHLRKLAYYQSDNETYIYLIGAFDDNKNNLLLGIIQFDKINKILNCFLGFDAVVFSAFICNAFKIPEDLYQILFNEQLLTPQPHVFETYYPLANLYYINQTVDEFTNTLKSASVNKDVEFCKNLAKYTILCNNGFLLNTQTISIN